MEVRHGRDSDREATYALWQQCFGADAFCDWFFKRLYDARYLRVLEMDGRLVSMAFCFPRMIRSPQGNLSAWYLYGIGTEKSARGNGAARTLIHACVEEARKNQIDCCFLIPAEESLFGYYEKVGFSQIWKRSTVRNLAQSVSLKVELTAVNETEFFALNRYYESAFSAFVCRDLQDWKLISEDFHLAGGEISWILQDSHPIGYCCTVMRGETLSLRELVSDVPTKPLCHAIAANFGAKEWVLHRPGETVPFSMALPLSARAQTFDFEINCDLLYN